MCRIPEFASPIRSTLMRAGLLAILVTASTRSVLAVDDDSVDPTPESPIVVSWTAFVDAEVLEEIRKLKSVPGAKLDDEKDLFYFRRSGDDVRKTLAAHLDQPLETAALGNLLFWSPTPKGARQIDHNSMFTVFNGFPLKGESSERRSMRGSFTRICNCRVQNADNNVSVRDRARISLEYTYLRRGEKQNERVHLSREVLLETTLHSGEAIVSVVIPECGEGWRPVLLLVYEVVRIPQPLQAQLQNLPNIEDWLRTGKAGKVEQASQIEAWEKRADHQAINVNPQWTRPAGKSGGTIELVSLSRPGRFPGISWNPSGHPVQLLSSPNPDEYLEIVVRIWEPDVDRYVTRLANRDEEMASTPLTPKAQFYRLQWQKPEDWKTLRVGAGFGPWTSETKLGLDEAVTVDGVEYKADLERNRIQGRFQVSARRSRERMGRINSENETWIVAITSTGEVIQPKWPLSYQAWRSSRLLFTPHFTFEKDGNEIDHFLIKKRPIEWVDFEGFAIEPDLVKK